MEKLYDHEKLKVYQLSLDFVEWRDGILGMIKKKINVCDHLDRMYESRESYPEKK